MFDEFEFEFEFEKVLESIEPSARPSPREGDPSPSLGVRAGGDARTQEERPERGTLPPPPQLSPFLRIYAGKAPARGRDVLDKGNPAYVGLRVVRGISDTKLAPPSRPKPPGAGDCPPHWAIVPELPEQWQSAPRRDKDGFGRLYRFQMGGVWWLVTFLPPYDGRVSLTDPEGGIRTFPSLEEALWFAWTLAAE